MSDADVPVHLRATLDAIPAYVPGKPAQAQPGCISGNRSYARLADLPDGAAAALGFRMAERGQPFQVTDVIAPGPRLPGSRFVAARQQGCRLSIRYERGGIAHTYEGAQLERRGNRWVVLKR